MVQSRTEKPTLKRNFIMELQHAAALTLGAYAEIAATDPADH